MRVFEQDWFAPKAFHEGTQRTRVPSETLAWLLAKSRRMGITRLANVTGLDTVGIPVWVAIRPNSKGLATSQGKGLTHDAARVSALMESIESWHAETLQCAVRIADYRGICELGPAIDPLTLATYADATPRADQALPWVRGFDLVSQSDRWVPYHAVSTDYTVDARFMLDTGFVQSSNGLSGGNHLLEAICHGLCEVIERHAIAGADDIISELRADSLVTPRSIAHDGCAEMLHRLDRAGIVTAICRLPDAFGLAAFSCSIVDADDGSRWRTLPPFNGYGCHLDAGVALSRAISEAVQSRLTYISGSRDDIARSEYERGSNPDELAAFRRKVASGIPALDYQDLLSEAEASFEADIARILSALCAAGHTQVVVVDLAKPDIGIPVVKVVVPGLAIPSALLGGRPLRRADMPRAKEGVTA